MKIATMTGAFKDYVAREDIASAVRLLAKCGYKHVDATLDSLAYEGSPLRSDNWREWAEGIRKAGEEVGEQIYHFFDKSERHIALRAEMTPTLARMVAQRQKELRFPLKWTTIAQCFRYERMTKGRNREHYQWNLDIIGEDSVLAEAEVIGAGVDALKRMGLSSADFKVHVSSRKFLGELLEKSGITPEKHAQVFLALDKRGKMPDAEIAAMLRDGGLSEAEVSATFAIMDTKSYAGCAELEELFALAEAAGFADSLMFDISVIRGLS